MKVTQEKPKVVGYRQVGFRGRDYSFNHTWDLDLVKVISKHDFALTRVKSKFRPVYEVKNES